MGKGSFRSLPLLPSEVIRLAILYQRDIDGKMELGVVVVPPVSR